MVSVHHEGLAARVLCVTMKRLIARSISVAVLKSPRRIAHPFQTDATATPCWNLIVVRFATKIEGLGVLGFDDSLSDGRIGEVEDAQRAIRHPRDGFDAVEGLTVHGGEGG